MANSAVIGILRAVLQLDTAEFDSASARVSQSAKAWSKDFNTVGQQATKLGSSLTKALTVPLVAIGAGAAKLAMDFESSFAGVGKTVDGVMDKGGQLTEFGKTLAQSFRDLSKQIPVNVNDLNRLGEAAGALGIPQKSILSFTKVMAELGVTTNLTADQAANSVARIQNIFGAAGQDTDRLASTLVALGNAGASTESEIVEMAQRIAGAGHTIGLTQAQVLSFASTLASVGINAEAGGSAISRIFLKMNDAVMGGGAALTEFARVAGVSAADFKTAFEKDASQATVMFIDGLKRLKGQGENTNATMEGMIGKNIILKDTLNRLTGAGDLLSKQLELGNKAWKDNTALTEEAEKRFQTTSSQLQLLWNRVQDVGISLGQALLPAVKSAISIFNGFVPVIEGAVKMFAALPGPIQLGVVGLGAIVAAAGPVIYIFGQMALTSAAVTAAFTTNGLATRFLLADLGFLVTGMRTAALAAMTNVTAYGAMGAASIAATSAVKGLWAAMAAHPLVALAAGIGLVTTALVKLYESSQTKKQDALVSGIKAETIARAEQAGFILKSADAQSKYMEAVEALNYAENRRLGLVPRNLELEREQVELRVRNGQLTRETANIILATMEVEEQANTVRSKHISISDAAKVAEQGIQKEIAATGYTLAELTKSLKDDEQGFRAWAKQVGLSPDVIKRVEAGLKTQTKAHKDNTAEMKESERQAKELEDRLDKTAKAMQALGLITERDVNHQMGQFQEMISLALANGVPFDKIIGAIIPKMEQLAEDAKRSGVSILGLSDAIRQLKNAMPSPTAIANVIKQYDVSDPIFGFKMLNAEQLKTQTNLKLTGNAFAAFGLKTKQELASAAAAARQYYHDLVASGQASAADLIEAREKVTAAEIAAGETTIGIWKGLIYPVVSETMRRMTGEMSQSLTDMLTGATSFHDGFVSIWESIKTAVRSILDNIINHFLTKFLIGMLEGFGNLILGSTSFSTSFASSMSSVAASSTATTATVVANFAQIAAAAGTVAVALLAIYGAYKYIRYIIDNPVGQGTIPAPPADYAADDPRANPPASGYDDRGNIDPNGPYGDQLRGSMSDAEWQQYLDNYYASARPMAKGALVTGPTFAMVGEAGPEAVLPLSDLSRWLPDMPQFRQPMAAEGATVDARAWASGDSFKGNVYMESRLVGRALFEPIVREAARQQVTQR